LINFIFVIIIFINFNSFIIIDKLIAMKRFIAIVFVTIIKELMHSDWVVITTYQKMLTTIIAIVTFIKLIIIRAIKMAYLLEILIPFIKLVINSLKFKYP